MTTIIFSPSWEDICRCGEKRNIHFKGVGNCYICDCKRFSLKFPDFKQNQTTKLAGDKLI